MSAGEARSAAKVRPWTRCAVCGYRKWTHKLLHSAEFLTSRSPLTPPPPRRGWFQ